jgi:hypothetical protein
LSKRDALAGIDPYRNSAGYVDPILKGEKQGQAHETSSEPGRYQARQESEEAYPCVEFHMRELMSQDRLIEATG